MQLAKATPWHIGKFARVMTDTEKNAFWYRYKCGFATYLGGMIAPPSEAFVLMARNNVPVAAFSVDPSGRLLVFCHPHCYHSGHNLAPAVLPIYRRWVARYGSLEAWPVHWDKNALRWYSDLRFVEPPDAIMMYSRPHEPRLLVPGPEITCTENPPRKSACAVQRFCGLQPIQ